MLIGKPGISTQTLRHRNLLLRRLPLTVRMLEIIRQLHRRPPVIFRIERMRLKMTVSQFGLLTHLNLRLARRLFLSGHRNTEAKEG
jgi:hypothetical protein